MLNLVLRSVLTIAIGILLIVWRETFLPFLVQCVGVAFLLPGLVAIVSYFVGRGRDGAAGFGGLVTFSAIGSMLFGLWLLLQPAFFEALFMNLLGVLMMLIGAYQLYTLLTARRDVALPLTLFVVPVLLVLLGVLVILNPFAAASVPFLLLGVGAVVSGLSDIVNMLVISRKRKNVTLPDVADVTDAQESEN